MTMTLRVTDSSKDKDDDKKMIVTVILTMTITMTNERVPKSIQTTRAFSDCSQNQSKLQQLSSCSDRLA